MIPDNEELFEVVLTGNEFVHDPEIPNPSIVGTFTDEGLRFTSVISLIDQNQKNIPESQYEYIGYKQTT
ncbi:hypothetical protein [Spirosoma oryzae]|nr:hypothetical protein [Spirosoma oryzae]